MANEMTALKPILGLDNVTIHDGIDGTTITARGDKEYGIDMISVLSEEETIKIWNTRTPPKVKDLKWRETEDELEAFAHFPLSALKYRIYQNGVEAGSDKTWAITLHLLNGKANTLYDRCRYGKDYVSPQSAKAAAQEHYNNLILSALEI